MTDTKTLRTILDYNTETGDLVWKKRPRHLFSSDNAMNAWNARYAGTPALASLDTAGYQQGSLLNRKVRKHRVIWQLMTGEVPDVIDHINGVKTDNRWRNIRNVSLAENHKNSGIPRDNKSGQLGVHWDRRRRKWIAKITVSRKIIHLGTHAEKADAVFARKAAERLYRFHENHGQIRALLPEREGK